jgi:hypothetical protein
MKTLKISLLALTLGLMSFSVITNKSVALSKLELGSILSWKSDVLEVGKIPQGTSKLIVFEFKNTSKNKSVKITNVKPACGCTAADYTKDNIAPGKSGFIKATYNAAAVGPFTKTVTVTTTEEKEPKILTFKGTVEPKKL